MSVRWLYSMARLLLNRRPRRQFRPKTPEVIGPQVLAAAFTIGDQFNVCSDKAGELIAVCDLAEIPHRRAALTTARLRFQLWGLPQPLEQSLHWHSCWG